MPGLTGHLCTTYCHSERAQRAKESGRWAKAAGEENLCRLFPAAGAAVAAGPASTGSVARQPHPICDQKPLVLVTELSANPIRAQEWLFLGTDSAQTAF